MSKQLALFNSAAGGPSSPGVLLGESIKSELLALMTQAIVATYVNEKQEDNQDEGHSSQD